MKKTTVSKLPLWRRATATFVALIMAAGPMTPALAAVTLLADEPIAFVPRAEPNVVMTNQRAGDAK